MSDIVKDKIIGIIASEMNMDESKVKENMNFRDDLFADSLTIFKIIIEIEDEFKIKISDEDADKISTVGDAVKHVKRLTEK